MRRWAGNGASKEGMRVKEERKGSLELPEVGGDKRENSEAPQLSRDHSRETR